MSVEGSFLWYLVISSHSMFFFFLGRSLVPTYLYCKIFKGSHHSVIWGSVSMLEHSGICRIAAIFCMQ